MQEYAADPQGQRREANAPGNGEKQEVRLERTDSEILLAITELAAGTPAVPDLLKTLVPLLSELAKCNVVSFGLHDAARNGIVADFWKDGQEAGLEKTFSVDDSPCGWVWQHQEPLTIPDIEQETRFAGALHELRKLGIRSYTALPLTTTKFRYGAIGVGGSESEAGKPSKLPFLTRAARIVGLALENQDVHFQLQKQRNRMQSLASIAREFSALDLDQLIPTVFASVRKITGYDYAGLALLEPDKQSLRILGVEPALNGARPPRESEPFPLAGAISAQAIQTRQVAFYDAEQLDKFNGLKANEIRAVGVQSLCSVPLMLGDHILGTMLLGANGENAYSRDEGEYLQQVANQIAAALHNARSRGKVAQAGDGVISEERPRKGEIRGERSGIDAIVGKSPALKRVLDYAAVVAGTDATVLITGETGTGKERVARAIHLMSQRRDNALIKVNCAAIPTGLLESELFGHEKGAFTGAVSQKVGRLELADKGTLLLDEVGEIPLELQPKLLRVLQDQEFERLGGTKTIRVDVRLIAASNRDLEQAVEEKLFRSDLFYRLHVFPLHLPALRERREDIPMLIRHFVEKSAAELKKRIDIIPDEAVEAMMNWDWPGNIRELENFIARSVILSEGNRLRPPLSELREPSRRLQESAGTLRGLERDHILEILRQARGVLSGPGGAAARLGLKRTTLQYKIQKLGISRSEYLD
jgi:formate hydrogenlyase transcriptional activator